MARRVGDWELEPAPIGSGSFAIVWKARNLRSGVLAAVKEIITDRLSPKLHESLESEIAVLRRVQHRNVVRLLDLIQVGARELHLVWGGSGCAPPRRASRACMRAWHALGSCVCEHAAACIPAQRQRNPCRWPHGLWPTARHATTATHPNTQEPGKLFLALEFCSGGDLGQYLRRYRSVSEPTARYFMRQLSEGLRELHALNVLHVSVCGLDRG